MVAPVRRVAPHTPDLKDLAAAKSGTKDLPKDVVPPASPAKLPGKDGKLAETASSAAGKAESPHPCPQRSKADDPGKPCSKAAAATAQKKKSGTKTAARKVRTVKANSWLFP